jgi:hypothetical protein
MKIQIITIILSIILFQSCKLGTTGTTMNENISAHLKAEIKELDKKVLKAIVENNVEDLKSFMSSKLLEKSGNEIEKLIEKVSGIIESNEYEIIDQYFVQNSTSGLGNTVMSGIDGIDDYVIQYQALNDEMFISLILPENGNDEFLITNIYGKYPEGWKLNILQFGQYTVNSKTAPQLFQQAKIEYEKGYLVDAANNMFLSSRVVNPANKFWKYQKEDEFREFYDKVLKEVNEKHNFPMTISEVKSKPQILTISPFGMNEGYFPMIEYLTKIDLKDTIQTRIENDGIHKKIGKIFKGIDKDKKYIFYKAFSGMPDGKTKVPTYGFVKKLKKENGG